MIRFVETIFEGQTLEFGLRKKCEKIYWKMKPGIQDYIYALFYASYLNIHPIKERYQGIDNLKNKLL